MSLPARVAYDLPAIAAGEVPEGIVSGPAEDRAAVAVVVLVAQEAVGVTQLGSAGGLQILEPLVSHGEVTLGGDPADQTLRVVCKSQQRMLVIGHMFIMHDAEQGHTGGDALSLSSEDTYR